MLNDENSPSKIWKLFNSVEAEAVVNALRRWQSSFGITRRPAYVIDPYVRLILDRCLPAEVEQTLCKEPLDRLMQDVIAVRTAVIDENLMEWTKKDGIKQVVILASGMDTRAWRLPWPPQVTVYEVDSAMIQAQKMSALGTIQPNCQRVALIGDTFNLNHVVTQLRRMGWEAELPCSWVVEDVVEYMLPQLVGEMFAIMAASCASGSRMVVTLSDVRLRDLMRRYGHSVHLIEEYEPPGVTLNRILMADWQADIMLSGELDHRFDVHLNNCLYIALAWKPQLSQRQSFSS